MGTDLIFETIVARLVAIGQKLVAIDLTPVEIDWRFGVTDLRLGQID